MSGLNKVLLIGNLCADPEARVTASGMNVANMRVATNSVTKNGEQKTEFHSVVAFDKLAENCTKFLQKGRQVYVEGHLQTSVYEKEGEKRYRTEIVARRIDFLGGKPAEGGQKPAETGKQADGGGWGDDGGDGFSNDIPF